MARKAFAGHGICSGKVTMVTATQKRTRGRDVAAAVTGKLGKAGQSQQVTAVPCVLYTDAHICQNSANTYTQDMHFILCKTYPTRKNYKDIKYQLMIRMLTYFMESTLVYATYSEIHLKKRNGGWGI